MAKKLYQPPLQGMIGMIVDSLLLLVLVFFALKAPEMIKNWNTAEPPPAAEAAAPATEPAEATADEAVPAEAAVEETAPAEAAASTVTWEQLGQNQAMQDAWVKLGKDPAAAEAIISNKFDYTIDVGKLLLVIALIAFYFIYMLTMSARQFKDVISEKFD